MHISDYPAYTKNVDVDSDWYIPMDSTTYGTYKMTPSDLLMNLHTDSTNAMPSGSHANIYRGKNLGTSPSSTQYSAINSGSFSDIFIGDFWLYSGYHYIVMDIDYYYGASLSGTYSPGSVHHLVMMPRELLVSGNCPIHTDTSDQTYRNGWTASMGHAALYWGSTITSYGSWHLARTQVQSFAGSYLRATPVFSPTLSSSYRYNGGSYNRETVMLPSEQLVFGTLINGKGKASIYGEEISTVNAKQFRAFYMNHAIIYSNSPDLVPYWLCDMGKSGEYSIVLSDRAGRAGFNSTTIGVRPYFVLSGTTAS